MTIFVFFATPSHDFCPFARLPNFSMSGIPILSCFHLNLNFKLGLPYENQTHPKIKNTFYEKFVSRLSSDRRLFSIRKRPLPLLMADPTIDNQALSRAGCNSMQFSTFRKIRIALKFRDRARVTCYTASSSSSLGIS